MADKNLDGNGLSEVWVRTAQLVKKYTGAVDSTKGDLQTQVNEKLSGTDDTKDNTVTFTSADESNPTAWKDVNVLSSNEKHSLILDKISNMFSNIRYLYKNVGGIKGLSSSSAITTQGEYALDAREKNASVEGTLANQISNLNSNLPTKVSITHLIETIECASDAFTYHTFSNLPTHKLSIPILLGSSVSSKGVVYGRDMTTSGKIWLNSPIDQTIEIMLVLFI